MRTVYVRFVRVHQNDDAPTAGVGTELLSHTTLPDTAVPRTGDYIDVPDSDGVGFYSVVEKVTWFYTKEQGVPRIREVEAVWVQVTPSDRS